MKSKDFNSWWPEQGFDAVYGAENSHQPLSEISVLFSKHKRNEITCRQLYFIEDEGKQILILAFKFRQASFFEVLQFNLISYKPFVIGISSYFIAIHCIVLAPCLKCFGCFIYGLNSLSNQMKMIKKIRKASWFVVEAYSACIISITYSHIK